VSSRRENHILITIRDTTIFITWFGQVEHLPTSTCGVPMDKGCTQPLSSDPMIHLNTTVFFLISYVPFVRNLHKLEPLTLTILITMKKHKSKGGIETHTRARVAAMTHTHKSRREHTKTTQRVHNSISAQISITMIQIRACGV
jgi:hypothetical protein